MLFRQIPRTSYKSLTSIIFPRNFTPRSISRNMATGTGQKCEWLVVLPDHEGSYEQRMKVRPYDHLPLPPISHPSGSCNNHVFNSQHLEKIMPAHESGVIPVGGALLSEPPKEGQPLPIIGSALIAYAETKEEVIEILKKDIYTTSGVWDLSKMQIWPFRSALRKGLKGGA